MKLFKGFFVVLAFIFTLFLTTTESFAYGTYCPIPAGNSCNSCHSTPGTNGWPACPTSPPVTTWTITASAGAGGSISPSGAVTVTNGGSQQYTITPSAGYQINNVVVDNSSMGAISAYTFSNVTANHSISASFSQPAGPPPTADFSMTPQTSTDPYIVSFTDMSTGSPTSWLWDFGDGLKSSEQDPYHGYLSPGTYTVTLQSANRNGLDIRTQNINVAFTACPNEAVDLGGLRQASIQTAYDSAGNGDVIMIQARDFTEDIILDRNITITLSGGYDCNYIMNPAKTIIPSGSLTISSGTLIIENLLIQSSASATLDGAVLYADNCALCHGDLANSTKIPTTTTAVQSAIYTNVGGMGYLNFLTPGEVQAIVDALNVQTPPSQPPPTDCTACHGQPPATGGHTVHTALGLGSVVPTCAACHDGAAHQNGYPDLGFPAGFDAQSGPATDNLDGTCSSVKCHGGQTTPDWWNGSINVNTQCASCHTRRTTNDGFPDQYNDYYSGEHSRHVVSEGYACTVCHNTSVLQNGHFSNLETSTFEQDPAATIGGGSTRVGNYNGSTCSNIQCHGSETW